MNEQAQAIIQQIHKIDRRTAHMERLLRKTHANTQHEMPWIFAAAVALVIVTLGYINYPSLPDSVRNTIDQPIDRAQNTAYTIGQWFADYTGNIDRSYTTPAGTLTLIGLTPLQSCRWRAALLMRESSGNYQHPGNAYGYFAGYAFGAEALSIVGLIDPHRFAAAPRKVRNGTDQAAWLNQPENWTLPNGKPAFLANSTLQDRAVTVLANQNIKDGFKARTLLQTQTDRIAGFAAAAHLKGLTAAISWTARGDDSHDANGTNTSDYYRMGAAAINTRSRFCAENPNEGGLWNTLRFWK